nr:hypothetical protein [Oscillospiraceae bacterium]
MTSFFRKAALVFCAAALITCAGCGENTPEPLPTVAYEVITLPTAPPEEEAPEVTNPKESVEQLTVVMEAGEIYLLDHYPNLKSVDLTGSTCYETILDYCTRHPEVDVTYAVSLGQAAISNKQTTATLAKGSFDYAALLENLKYLPALTAIELPDVSLTGEQITALREAYPEVALGYTVELLGKSCDVSVTELDLSQMVSSQVDEAIGKLGLLTNLQTVRLSGGLSLEDVAKLQDANPHTQFQYSFSLFGKTVSTTDMEIIYKNQNIGNDGEADIRRALPVLDACQRFVLDNCKLDYEVLAGIREDFRDGPKVVWRVYFGKDGRYNTLTDDDVIRCVENVTDDTCGPMKYLEDVKHMDLGHNDTLTDLSFMAYMTKLETAIVSGCAVSDISGFENLKNLIWLEMAYCAKLKDITPLAGCENLKYLNLSFTGVSNYMALDGLPLERFVCLSPKASTKEQNTFIEIHPKDTCITVFYGQKNPYSYGWRYDDYGNTMFWYYKDVIREVFNYDQADAILKAQKENE